MARFFRRERVDVVHTHSEGPLLYGVPAARLAGVRRLIHTRHHGPDLGNNSRRAMRAVALVSRWVDRVVCVADDGARTCLAEGVPADRIVTVWNGIDLARFAYSGPRANGSAVIVARLSPEKDHATLLRAWALVATADPDFPLEIAGDGPLMADLKTLAGSLGLGDRVRFLGRVDDVPGLLERSGMLLLSSRLEGISLTLLEAMARGLPVIATRVGGNPEVVSDGETGFLVPPGSPSELAAAVLRLRRDPELSRRMGHSGRDRTERFFDVRRTVRDYEDLYINNGALNRTRAAAGGDSMLNVVVVGSDLPYPANSGGRIRTLNLLVRLAKSHRVTYIGTRNADRAEGRAALEYLGDHRVKAIEVEHTVPAKAGLRFYARLAANLASPLPYSVATHQSPALTRAVRGIAAKGGVDLWQAEWAAGVAAFRGLTGARKLVMAHNVETLIWERYRENEPDPVRRWYIGLQSRKFERFERRSFAEADRVVTVTADDAALVRGRFGMPRVDVVDNGIDRDYFEAVSADRDPFTILYLGSLDWRPNQDALNLLLDRIFPMVRAGEPRARLEVVGRNPPEALARRAAEVPGVSVHANVADVRPFLGRGSVMAVPLRIGGGSRLKILEALASGLPVVSTRVGAEGLCLRDGEHLVIADDPDAIASALLDALREPTRARILADRGRKLVYERYDWDVLAGELERSWERCLVA